jgi:hypothetical protein
MAIKVLEERTVNLQEAISELGRHPGVDVVIKQLGKTVIEQLVFDEEDDYEFFQFKFPERLAKVVIKAGSVWTEVIGVKVFEGHLFLYAALDFGSVKQDFTASFTFEDEDLATITTADIGVVIPAAYVTPIRKKDLH